MRVQIPLPCETALCSYSGLRATPARCSVVDVFGVDCSSDDINANSSIISNSSSRGSCARRVGSGGSGSGS
eukprot:15483844-Alexandrium_andersonii.AAC.1